jgi:hypothetical protein
MIKIGCLGVVNTRKLCILIKSITHKEAKHKCPILPKQKRHSSEWETQLSSLRDESCSPRIIVLNCTKREWERDGLGRLHSSTIVLLL